MNPVLSRICLPRCWYTLEELRQGTIEWKILTVNFTYTFEFTSEHPIVDATLQVIKDKIFEEIPVTDKNFHKCSMIIHNWIECYNIMGESDDDYPLEINITMLEGIRTVEGFSITSGQFLKPLKIKKVNIGSNENPKCANIGVTGTTRQWEISLTYCMRFGTC